MSCLTSIHVLIFATHLHPGDISAPSRSLELHLNSIHVQSQTHPDLKMCVLPISRPCLICIQVSRFLHQLLQCTFSPPSRPRKCKSTQFRPISNSFWYQDVCFTSIHVLPHQLPGPKILVSSPSMYLAHFHPGPKIPISPSSMYSSTSAWVTTLVSHIQACHVSHNQDWVLCLAFIQVTFNWLVGHENSISAPF